MVREGFGGVVFLPTLMPVNHMEVQVEKRGKETESGEGALKENESTDEDQNSNVVNHL